MLQIKAISVNVNFGTMVCLRKANTHQGWRGGVGVVVGGLENTQLDIANVHARNNVIDDFHKEIGSVFSGCCIGILNPTPDCRNCHNLLAPGLTKV